LTEKQTEINEEGEQLATERDELRKLEKDRQPSAEAALCNALRLKYIEARLTDLSVQTIAHVVIKEVVKEVMNKHISSNKPIPLATADEKKDTHDKRIADLQDQRKMLQRTCAQLVRRTSRSFV
jgi:hypothetical protein